MVLVTGFALLVLLAPHAVALETDGAELSWLSRSLLRYSDTAGFEQRLLVDTDQSRLFVGYGLAPGQDYFTAGFRSPQITVGPVAIGGLVREVYRPTRFSSGSDVYRESSGLSLDSALDPARRLGVQIQPSDRFPAIFAVVRDDDLELLGAHWSGQIGAVDAAVIGLEASPPAEKPDESWYTEYPRYPGGRLRHLGVELAAARRTGRATSKRIAVAGFSSAGTLVAPSSASRLRLEHRSSLVRANSVVAVVSPGYVGPDGRVSRDAAHLAGTARLGRNRGAYLQTDGGYRFGRAPLRVGRVSPRRREATVGVGVIERPVGRAMRVSTSGSGAWSETTDDRGHSSERIVVDATIAAARGGGRVRLSASRTWFDGIADRDRVELTATARSSGISAETRVVAMFEDSIATVGARIEARARFERLEIFGRVGTIDLVSVDNIAEDRSIPFGFSFGAEIRRSFSLPSPSGSGSMNAVPTPRPEALRVRG